MLEFTFTVHQTLYMLFQMSVAVGKCVFYLCVIFTLIIAMSTNIAVAT